MTGPPKIAILGAGASGLAAGLTLKDRGASVTVFEAGRRAGGVIATHDDDGYLYESGPNSLVDNSPEIFALLARLKLVDQMVFASEKSRKRFIVKNGRALAVPTSPLGLLSTGLFSAAGKARITREPFVKRRAGDSEESVAAFFGRRLGPEVVDYAIEPFIAGIYAGNPDILSIRHAFPRVHLMERRHGSLFRGGIAAIGERRAMNERPPSRKLYSFAKGLATLTDTMAVNIGDSSLALSTRVTGIEKSGDGWIVEAKCDGAVTADSYDAVVSTLPTHQLEHINFSETVAGRLSRLREIRYAPVAVAVLGFNRDEVSHKLDGFGMLIPRLERLHILGALFSSSLFPGRAPDDSVLLTVFLGGERSPKLLDNDDGFLIGRAMADLRPLLGITGQIQFQKLMRHDRAIPQYEIGYGGVLDAIEEIESAHPNLFFSGSYRDGISVPDTITGGMRIANRVADVLLGDPS